MCIMLTMESTIMDIAIGVDATDWRNVLFLFGFSLDGGRRIGIVRRFVRRDFQAESLKRLNLNSYHHH